MPTQSYYLTDLEYEADICDYSKPLIVNCVGITDEECGFSITSYVRNDFYFLYVISGKVNASFGIINPGEFIIIEPQTPYSYTGGPETSYLFVHFTGYESIHILQNCGIPTNTKIRIGIHDVLSDRFEAMYREFMINDEQSFEMRVSILKEILILTGRYANGDTSRMSPLKSIAYINKHYTKNIKIEELAALENMSLTKFRLAFKIHTSLSPLDYITLKRISYACLLLSQSDSSIAEISRIVGYDDPYYFSRIFKKKMNLSPRQYRHNSSGGQ